MRLANFPKTFRIAELEKDIFPFPTRRPRRESRLRGTFTQRDVLWSRRYEPRQSREILRVVQQSGEPRLCLRLSSWYHTLVPVRCRQFSAVAVWRFASCFNRWPVWIALPSVWQSLRHVILFSEGLFFLRMQSPSSLQVFTPEKNQSLIALKLLIYITQRDNIAIRHARDHGEQRIGKFLVDGYNGETNTVWEIQGYLWHGYPHCYARDTINTVKQPTMHELYERTLEKFQVFKGKFYNVLDISTCNIDRKLATNPEMKTFFDNFEISEPLEKRQGFFGGRTNATRLFHETHAIWWESALRLFCSLYPWCNKYGKYPLAISTLAFSSVRSCGRQ